MSIGLCHQRLPRQATGQQTVRPCNNVSSCSSPFIAALPAGRCSPPAHPAMWLQNPRCTTGLPHRRGDWCGSISNETLYSGSLPQTATFFSGWWGAFWGGDIPGLIAPRFGPRRGFPARRMPHPTRMHRAAGWSGVPSCLSRRPISTSRNSPCPFPLRLSPRSQMLPWHKKLSLSFLTHPSTSLYNTIHRIIFSMLILGAFHASLRCSP